MKAVICSQYGSPHLLSVQEVDKPRPKNNEVLVKVHVTTLNRTDCAILDARPFIIRFAIGLLKPKKSILGTDFAGEIVKVGKDVTSFKVGDRVFGFNDLVLSSHAEYTTISEGNNFITIPENITYKHAVSSIEGAHYACNFINKVAIKRGQKILVNGATGAIGSAMVQLLNEFDVEITATCSTKNIELIKSLGADVIIDYTKEDFTKMNQKYDFVFDTVGKSSFGKCKPLIAPKGAYISSELGKRSENIFYALFTPIFGNKKVIIPIPSNIKKSLLLIKNLLEQGKYKSVIDREYSLDQIIEAYKYVQKGEKTGNVIISLR